jgi:hypothetical protein
VWTTDYNDEDDVLELSMSFLERGENLPVRRMLRWLIEVGKEYIQRSQRGVVALALACWAHDPLVEEVMTHFLTKDDALSRLEMAASFDNWHYIRAADKLYGRDALITEDTFWHVLNSRALSQNTIWLMVSWHFNYHWRHHGGRMKLLASISLNERIDVLKHVVKSKVQLSFKEVVALIQPFHETGDELDPEHRKYLVKALQKKNFCWSKFFKCEARRRWPQLYSDCLDRGWRVADRSRC